MTNQPIDPQALTEANPQEDTAGRAELISALQVLSEKLASMVPPEEPGHREIPHSPRAARSRSQRPILV
ncbi:MAG: hypothetical protein LVS60_05515 [Nodosilinea sp. LVE1205-7]|jgi:hypothetical protein